MTLSELAPRLSSFLLWFAFLRLPPEEREIVELRLVEWVKASILIRKEKTTEAKEVLDWILEIHPKNEAVLQMLQILNT